VIKPKSKPVLKTTTARELQDMTFPDIKYVLPDYILEGLTLLAAKPKVGKSWLMLNCAIAVAEGTTVLNKNCQQGDVLYCALEDGGLRRSKLRIRQLLGDREWPKRLHLIADMPRLADGGLEFLKAWCKHVGQGRLIIIDTYKMVKSIVKTDRQQTLYDLDYDAVAELRSFAADHGMAVILVYHLRKSVSLEDALDEVNASLGLTAAVDSVLVIRRKNANSLTVYGRGRDIAELEKALAFDAKTGVWTELGDAAEVYKSQQRVAIVDALKEAGQPQTPKEIAGATEMKVHNVQYLLKELVEDGDVQKGRIWQIQARETETLRAKLNTIRGRKRRGK
jgi:RecA-family ATPase